MPDPAGGEFGGAAEATEAVVSSDVGDLRAVLRYRAFRKLWMALSLSSLGDWLGLLALTALAQELATSRQGGLYAIGGVLIFRLLPAVLLAPFAGAFADRFDRRRTMVVADSLRCAMFVTLPLVSSLPYLLAMSFCIESVSLFWIPAKEASIPNLVPRERLETANQLNLLTTYGSAPVAGAVFALLAVISHALGAGIPFFSTNQTDLALYFDAATFLFSALTVLRLREITGARKPGTAAETGPNLFRSIVEGWQFVAHTPLVRGLVTGILGAFFAGGAVIALGRPYVEILKGGNAGYGVLFAAIFTGLAGGMFVGPRLLKDFSRRRLFGLAIVSAGIALCIVAVLPNLVLALFVTLVLGAFAGIAWVTGYTLLGGEVADEVRGRTFSLVQSLVQVDLLLVLAAAPFVSAAIGEHSIRIARNQVRMDGVTIVLFVAGLVSVVVGLVSYRQMNDRTVPLWRDLWASIRGESPHATGRGTTGVFVVFEGGEGAGKSTLAVRIAEWLRGTGREVVITRQPGATDVGVQLRTLLLDPETSLTPRAEALLYAADRAEHVATVIRPALERGAVVLCDRYIDSSLAYQGAGRDLDPADIARVSRWAADGLVPDLTVLLDVDPEVGLRRAGGQPDRFEAESLDFHQRVRTGFRSLAALEPRRYLVVDAAQPPASVAAQVEARLRDLIGITGEGGPPVTRELPLPADDDLPTEVIRRGKP